MSDHMKDIAKMGIKILQDTKTAKKSVPKSKAIPTKEEPESDIHKAAVKKFIKDKPAKKHLIEFFEHIIEAEEKNL